MLKTQLVLLSVLHELPSILRFFTATPHTNLPALLSKQSLFSSHFVYTMGTAHSPRDPNVRWHRPDMYQSAPLSISFWHGIDSSEAVSDCILGDGYRVIPGESKVNNYLPEGACVYQPVKFIEGILTRMIEACAREGKNEPELRQQAHEVHDLMEQYRDRTISIDDSLTTESDCD